MTLGAHIPGPMGFYKAWPYKPLAPGPVGFGKRLGDLFEESKQDPEQKAYKILTAAWKRWYRWTKKGDCMAACFLVAHQFRYHGRWPKRYAPVKMFKQDKKWCKGNERVDAIARRNSGFKDIIVSKHVLVYQGPMRGPFPEDTLSLSLKPGMCIYTAEGYMKQNNKWRWALRHMRMYVGKGEYRDNLRKKHGRPVWRSSPTLYVVLGIWDPFAKNRASLFGQP